MNYNHNYKCYEVYYNGHYRNSADKFTRKGRQIYPRTACILDLHAVFLRCVQAYLHAVSQVSPVGPLELYILFSCGLHKACLR